MKKKKYTYLVSFGYAGGCGSTVIKTSFKIRKPEDITLLSGYIEADNNIKSVSVMNFILMDTDWGAWDWFKAILDLVLLVFLVLSAIAASFG